MENDAISYAENYYSLYFSTFLDEEIKKKLNCLFKRKLLNNVIFSFI